MVIILLCFASLIPSNADAQQLDLTDADSAGEKMVACWHHADKHLRTNIGFDKAAGLEEAGATADCVSRALEGKSGTWTTGPVKTGEARTAYRGAWLGANYEMKVEFYSKYVCKLSDGGGRLERWARAVNVRDDKSPEPNCWMENYRLLKSDTLGK